ncbi:MAG: hypothetical protein ACRDYA_02450 [Egibacteraceae bacterium]
MSTKADLGIEELDEFSPSPSLFSDLSDLVKGFFMLFSSFMG